MSKRVNFSDETKRVLGNRVAWRCSLPGCPTITIGPSIDREDSYVTLGDAAHIHAASKGGPRYRDDIDIGALANGIWLCQMHHRLIDRDFINHSPKTLRQWKEIAERKAYNNLLSLSADPLDFPKTLIQLGNKIVFEGIWLSANGDLWELSVNRFIRGTEEELISYQVVKGAESPLISYLIVETQGDGRIIDEKLGWKREDNHLFKVSFLVEPKNPRTDPNELGGDLDLFNPINSGTGDLNVTLGKDAIKQIVYLELSTRVGTLHANPLYGSQLTEIYWYFKDDLYLLSRLIKLEITRLIFVPQLAKDGEKILAPLSFINRVLDVRVSNKDLTNHKLEVWLKLELGDGSIWEDTLPIYIYG